LISDDLTVIREIINDDDAFFKLCGEYKKQNLIFIKSTEDFLKDERSEILKKHLSEDKVRIIHETFRGLTVYFPESIVSEKTNEQIYNDYLSGYEYKQLVRKYGRTIDNIRKICKRFRQRERENIDDV